MTKTNAQKAREAAARAAPAATVEDVKEFDEAATEEFTQTGSTTGAVLNPGDQPPVDNEHVAEGAEPFSDGVVAMNSPEAPTLPQDDRAMQRREPSDLAQAIAAEEGVFIPPPEVTERFIPEFESPEDLIAHLESLGLHELAQQLVSNLQNAQRWEANMEVQRMIEEDAKTLTSVEIVEPGSADDPFVQREPYFYEYTKEDVIGMVSAAIEGKAEGWEHEAYEDSQRGAGSPTTQNALKWGAAQLRQIADIVRALPDGELRVPEAPPEE